MEEMLKVELLSCDGYLNISVLIIKYVIDS